MTSHAKLSGLQLEVPSTLPEIYAQDAVEEFIERLMTAGVMFLDHRTDAYVFSNKAMAREIMNALVDATVKSVT